MSDVSEKRREEDYDYRCPRAVNRQVMPLALKDRGHYHYSHGGLALFGFFYGLTPPLSVGSGSRSLTSAEVLTALTRPH
jgi:hypothetical protein